MGGAGVMLASHIKAANVMDNMLGVGVAVVPLMSILCFVFFVCFLAFQDRTCLCISACLELTL